MKVLVINTIIHQITKVILCTNIHDNCETDYNHTIKNQRLLHPKLSPCSCHSLTYFWQVKMVEIQKQMQQEEMEERLEAHEVERIMLGDLWGFEIRTLKVLISKFI